MMLKWLRWQIALLLDRRKDTCWFDLATWALYPEQHGFWEVFNGLPLRGGCKRRGEANYCGKCDKVGA